MASIFLQVLSFEVFSVEVSKLKTAIILNYAHSALHKITSAQDSVILEEQYNDVLNNIDLTQINDRETVQVLRSLLVSLKSYKLKNQEVEMLEEHYEEVVGNVMLMMSRDAISAANGLDIVSQLPSPMSLMDTAASGYVNYKNNLTLAGHAFDHSKFRLEKQALLELSSLQSQFLELYWLIMRRYEIPDEMRISEKQLGYLQNAISDTDAQRKYRKLSSVIDEYKAFPDASYYYALAALNVGKQQEAKRYFQQVAEMDVNLFRQNTTLALSYMNLSMLAESKDERDDYLSKMMLETPLDGRKNLFAALSYMESKEYQKANARLQVNLDNDTFVLLSMKYQNLLSILLKDNHTYDVSFTKLLESTYGSGRDLFYMSAQHPELRQLEHVIDKVGSISMEATTTLFGSEIIEVTIPQRWIYDVLDETPVEVQFMGNTFSPSDIDIDETLGNVIFTFENMLDMENTQLQDHFVLLLSKGRQPVSFNYIFHNKKIKVEGFMSKSLASLQDFEITSGFNDELEDAKSLVSDESETSFELGSINYGDTCIKQMAGSWKKC
jgi:tetratricopeptide (TPR) repeat protein